MILQLEIEGVMSARRRGGLRPRRRDCEREEEFWWESGRSDAASLREVRDEL